MKHNLLLIFLISLIFDCTLLFAANLPTTLEADNVEGDQENNIITATGNVEVTNGGDKLKSNKLVYNKTQKIITATGKATLQSRNVGTVFSEEIKINDDFTNGELIDGKIIFDDGSYIKSPIITRENKSKTIFKNSIFSFCPNPLVKDNPDYINKDVSLFSLKSKNTTINKDESEIKLKKGLLRIKDVPVMYTPYLRVPLRSSGRKSGLLYPSYVNTNNLGFGLKIPYYFNISQNKDLKTTLQYHPSKNNVILENHYRHLLRNGGYNIRIENANNNIAKTDENIEQRWLIDSDGKFNFNNNVGLDFDIEHLSDKNYLRDYHNDFIGYNISHFNLDNIDNNNYNSVKLINIQELELDNDQEFNTIPILSSHLEKRGRKFNETYSLNTDAAMLSKNNGLQYKRLSLTPKITIPKNISGNIFKVSASVQSDLYNIDDTDIYNINESDYDGSITNHRPQASLSWNLPLIKKASKYSLVIEPKANFIVSSYEKDYSKIINEDTNNIELTQNNLFLEDRFVGFDRNESGQRLNYGINSKLFNKFGDFGFGIGQGYRKNNKAQDVKITGFNEDNMSNLVGNLSYKSLKIIDLNYNFQLNNHNYQNEISDLNLSLNFNNFNIYSNYLFIKNDAQSNQKQEQIYLGFRAKIYGNFSTYANITKDIVEDQIIMKRIGVDYNGCCVTYGFSAVEHKPVQFLEAEKSYNIHFTIKNF